MLSQLLGKKKIYIYIYIYIYYTHTYIHTYIKCSSYNCGLSKSLFHGVSFERNSYKDTIFNASTYVVFQTYNKYFLF